MKARLLNIMTGADMLLCLSKDVEEYVIFKTRLVTFIRRT